MKILKLKLLLIPLLTLFYHSTLWGKTLKIGLNQDFENLNPMVTSMLATTYIYGMVGRTLSLLNTQGKWEAHLVKDVPTLKNGLATIINDKGKKKLQAKWEIKKNAVWGDGTPITGHDVLFSWKVANSPNVPVGEKEVYSQVEKIIIDPKDSKKFTFVYSGTKWDFNRLGTFYILPSHLEEPVFKKFGHIKEGYSQNSLYVKNPTNPGLYSGPYVVEELKLGSHVLLKPNPKFYGKKAQIERILIKLIPNTGTLESNLLSKNIDMISLMGFTLDQAIQFEKKVKSRRLPYHVNFKPAVVYEHIDLQLSNPILKDVRVRKALVYAIDRDRLTQSLFEGKQVKAISSLTPLDPWYTDDPQKIVLYPYNRRKAKKLLKEAGWKKGSDGYLYKDGKKLTLNLMTTAGNKLRELVQVYLKAEWKKIGVEITIKNEPARVYFGETVKKSKFSGMAMYAFISSPENTPRSTLHSTNIPHRSNGYSGQNRPRWINKNVDKLIDRIDNEFDAQKRKEIMAKVTYHYTNEVPVIPLYYRSDISVTPKGLKGYELSGHQFPTTYYVENWSL